MQLVDGRVQASILVKVDVALLRGVTHLPDTDIVKVEEPVKPDEFSVEQIEQSHNLVVKRKQSGHRMYDTVDALDDFPPHRRIKKDVWSGIAQVSVHASFDVVRFCVLIAGD